MEKTSRTTHSANNITSASSSFSEPELSRRDLIKTAFQASAVAVGGTLLSGCLSDNGEGTNNAQNNGQASPNDNIDSPLVDNDELPTPIRLPFRIDVHCHHIPDFYRLSLAQSGYLFAGGIPIPQWTPELALSFMDRYGIEVQVLSISEPGVTHLSDAFERLTLARRINDYTSNLTNGYDPLTGTPNPLYSGRFGGFACLPLGKPSDADDVNNAISEIDRALGQLDLDGIGLLTHYDGVYLGDPAYEPILQALDAHRANVFLHPVTPAEYPELNLPTFLYEFTFDTTRAVVNMLYKGVFTRYPNINWILSHAGGAIPFLAYRTGLLTATPAISQTLQSGAGHTELTDDLIDRFVTPETNYPEAYRNLIYDTALSPTPASMLSTKEVAGTSNIQFGSDWPFSELLFNSAGDPAPQLNATFSEVERAKVERDNALELFPRIRNMLGE